MARLQFLVSDEMMEEIDALVESTGLKTRTQLLSTAVTLFEWAVRERKSGRIIASVDERTERYKEIELPGLPSVTPQEASALEEEFRQYILKFFKTQPERMVQNSDLLETIKRMGEINPQNLTSGEALPGQAGPADPGTPGEEVRSGEAIVAPVPRYKAEPANTRGRSPKGVTKSRARHTKYNSGSS